MLKQNSWKRLKENHFNIAIAQNKNTWACLCQINSTILLPLLYDASLLGNSQPGKEEGSSGKLALNLCAATRDLGLDPLNFHGTLSAWSQGKASSLGRFLYYRQNTTTEFNSELQIPSSISISWSVCL